MSSPVLGPSGEGSRSQRSRPSVYTLYRGGPSTLYPPPDVGIRVRARVRTEKGGVPAGRGRRLKVSETGLPFPMWVLLL